MIKPPFMVRSAPQVRKRNRTEIIVRIRSSRWLPEPGCRRADLSSADLIVREVGIPIALPTEPGRGESLSPPAIARNAMRREAPRTPR